MKKLSLTVILTGIVLALMPTLRAAVNAVRAAANTIVPGHRVGHIWLGQDLENVTRTLGPSQHGDAASGREWDAWSNTGQPNSELDIYSDRYVNYPDGRVNSHDRNLVEQVRVTSPWFSTRSGIHVGANLSQIRRQFPRIVEISYLSGPGQRETTLYDDKQGGIAFQTIHSTKQLSLGRCVAIIIHPRGKSALDEYYPIHPEVRWYRPGDPKY